MLEFADSTTLLGDSDALRRRFERDGYAFFRQQIQPGRLSALRAEITEICARHHWLTPGTRPIDALSQQRPRVEGDADYFPVYDEIQALESLHGLAHEPALMNIMRSLLGSSAFPHPLSICRLAFPGNSEWSTPPHQDYPNNQGTKALYAAWLPLGDCPVSQGPLSILSGSHRLGLLPLRFSLGAGHRQCQLDERHEALNWVGGKLDAGDVLVFHSLTVHRALPNQSGHLRLSVDYRYQREGEALTAGCLEPHFGRLSWEQIYRNWKNKDLQFYWHNKRFEVETWDQALHDIDPEDWQEGLKQRIRYERKLRQRHPE